MNNFNVIAHPLLEHKIGKLRNKNTQIVEFRLLIKELSFLLAFEATRFLKLKETEIETPLARTTVKKIADKPILVSIMRTGNGMLDGFRDLMPSCQVGFIGLCRDKHQHKIVEYYFKIPEDAKGKNILLLDPMLATGDTLLAALDLLKQNQVGKITVVNLLSYEKGAERVLMHHPDIQIFTAVREKELDKNNFLYPGVGDVGDRLFEGS